MGSSLYTARNQCKKVMVILATAMVKNNAITFSNVDILVRVKVYSNSLS